MISESGRIILAIQNPTPLATARKDRGDRNDGGQSLIRETTDSGSQYTDAPLTLPEAAAESQVSPHPRSNNPLLVSF
jgi:hypothetical protein